MNSVSQGGQKKNIKSKENSNDFGRCEENSLLVTTSYFDQGSSFPNLRGEKLYKKIHTGHQGIVRCRLRVAESIWWPGVSHEVEHFIKSCAECQKNTVPPREPLMSTDLPSYPWEKVASDLFEMNK